MWRSRARRRSARGGGDGGGEVDVGDGVEDEQGQAVDPLGGGADLREGQQVVGQVQGCGTQPGGGEGHALPVAVRECAGGDVVQFGAGLGGQYPGQGVGAGEPSGGDQHRPGAGCECGGPGDAEGEGGGAGAGGRGQHGQASGPQPAGCQVVQSGQAGGYRLRGGRVPGEVVQQFPERELRGVRHGGQYRAAQVLFADEFRDRPAAAGQHHRLAVRGLPHEVPELRPGVGDRPDRPSLPRGLVCRRQRPQKCTGPGIPVPQPDRTAVLGRTHEFGPPAARRFDQHRLRRGVVLRHHTPPT